LLPIWDKWTLKRNERRAPQNPYTAQYKDGIFQEVNHLKIVRDPPLSNATMIVSNPKGWCKYHKINGHTTNDCIHLKREIERLVQNGQLRDYIKRNQDEDRDLRGRTSEVRGTKDKDHEPNKNTQEQHTINTIAVGFAGGGESSSSWKRYVRQVMFIDDNRNETPTNDLEILLMSKDHEGVPPHGDDPMVITIQMFKWNIKRVLIDLGSLADILYEVFEKNYFIFLVQNKLFYYT